MRKDLINKKEQGFTLIELILYIAILSIFISGAILFAWDVIYGKVKVNIQQEVSENLRLAAQRISYEIRNAEDIVSASNSTITLSMEDSARNPTVFDVSNYRLRIGFGNTGSCAISSPCPITSNTVNVTNLVFEDLSTGGDESKNINFTITIESGETGGRKEWQKSQTYSTSVEVRSN